MITIFSANQVVIAVIHVKQCMLSFVGLSKTVMMLLVEGRTARITGTRCNLHRTKKKFIYGHLFRSGSLRLSYRRKRFPDSQMDYHRLLCIILHYKAAVDRRRRRLAIMEL